MFYAVRPRMHALNDVDITQTILYTQNVHIPIKEAHMYYMD